MAGDSGRPDVHVHMCTRANGEFNIPSEKLAVLTLEQQENFSIPSGRSAVLELEKKVDEMLSEATTSMRSHEIRAVDGIAKICVSSAFIKATVEAPNSSCIQRQESRGLLVNAKFGGKGVLHDPLSFRPKEALQDLSNFVERVWAFTLSCEPMKKLGIGMMVLESIDCIEHGEKNYRYYHIPLYFKCATEEDVTFSFTDKKQKRILRLKRNGQGYCRSFDAQNETVLAPRKRRVPIYCRRNIKK